MGTEKKMCTGGNGESSDESYEGATTKVRVGSGYSDEFSVTVGVHQGSVLSPLLFAIVMDVVTEKAREGLMNEVLQTIWC